ANDRLTARNSRYSGADKGNGPEPSAGNCVVTYINRSDCGYGRGRRRTPDTTEKIAAFAPMPSAIVRTATVEKPGARKSTRAAKRTSLQTFSNHVPRPPPRPASRYARALPNRVLA